MNLILLHPEDFVTGDSVRLTDRRHHHIRTVLQVHPGDTLKVGLVDGNIGSARVLSCGTTSTELAVSLRHAPPESPQITVILALPRPKALKRVLQGMTAFGIKRIILINSWRVDKSYWQSPALLPSAIQEQLLLGLEQGRDTILPRVEIQQRFKPFVEDRLPAIISGTSALVAHPGSTNPCPANLHTPVTLAVGPEGGFTTYEVDKLIGVGLVPVHLGARPLRVEAAVPALLGRLLPFPVATS